MSDRLLWHLRPEITKGKRKDVVPIVAELLPTIRRRWLALEHPTDRVFPRIPRTETLHKELIRAKVDRIDAEGRYIDFHSLRYFFCTLLAKQLPIQIVRLLMRHKNIRQTCDLYMDLGLQDVGEALLQLPAILPKPESV